MKQLFASLVIPVMILSACATSSETGPDVVTPAPAIGILLSSANRPDADKARDDGRKPAEVVEFMGIESGMTVVDLIAAGGYYTEVLSYAVGPAGKIYSQNNDFVLKMRDGVYDKELTARLANHRLPNVVRLDREISDLGLESGSIDAAFTALNYHDIANSRGPEAAARFLATVHSLLKPGGTLGLIDHAGNTGQDNKALHRIPRTDVIRAVTAAGFTVEAEGEMLRNPADDHTRNVFEPGMRGQTDRFVLRLRK